MLLSFLTNLSMESSALCSSFLSFIHPSLLLSSSYSNQPCPIQLETVVLVALFPSVLMATLSLSSSSLLHRRREWLHQLFIKDTFNIFTNQGTMIICSPFSLSLPSLFPSISYSFSLSLHLSFYLSFFPSIPSLSLPLSYSLYAFCSVSH